MKINKILLITAGLFLLCGTVVAGTAIILMNKAYSDDARMQTQTITENISKVNIFVDMSDIKIIPADTDKIVLTYFTDDTNKYEITTDNGILSIEYVRFKRNKAKWYDYYINFDFGRDHDVILNVPRNFSADIQLSADYGDIEVSGVKGGSMKINSDYGDIEIADCKFNSIDCAADYGDIDVERCEGKILNFSTDCGDIEGTIAGNEADYTINAETELGDKNINNKAGGQNTLDVKTDLGDIDIKFVR